MPPFQWSRAPALPNFGVLLYLCLHPLTQNNHVLQSNICRGEACFLGQRRLPSQEGGAPVFPNFGGSFYLSIQPLMQNDQIWRGITYGRCVFWGSATPLHIAQCVARFDARFVSDSRATCSCMLHINTRYRLLNKQHVFTGTFYGSVRNKKVRKLYLSAS